MWRQCHHGCLPWKPPSWPGSGSLCQQLLPTPGCCLLLLALRCERIELPCSPLPASPPGLMEKSLQSFCPLLALCDTGHCPCPRFRHWGNCPQPGPRHLPFSMSGPVRGSHALGCSHRVLLRMKPTTRVVHGFKFPLLGFIGPGVHYSLRSSPWP